MKASSYVEAHAAQVNASAGNCSLPATVKRSGNDSQASAALDVEALKQAKMDVSNMDVDQRIDAAKNEESSAEMLTVLSKDDNYWVRIGVARNKNTPAEALAALADDEWLVRLSVAKNGKTPAATLVALAEGDVLFVCSAAAENTRLPLDTLIPLSYSNNDDVSLSAQSNPSLPLTRILELAECDNDTQRSNVAINPALPYEYLLLLANDKSEKVRLRANRALDRRN